MKENIYNNAKIQDNNAFVYWNIIAKAINGSTHSVPFFQVNEAAKTYDCGLGGDCEETGNKSSNSALVVGDDQTFEKADSEYSSPSGIPLNYEEFKASLTAEIKQLEPDKCLLTHPVLKSNNRLLDGFSICESESTNEVVPTQYFNECYEIYRDGVDVSEIARHVVDIARQSYPAQTMNLDFMLDFENIKDMLCCKLINTAMNKELLTYTPHLNFLDLSVVFYLLIKQDDGVASCLVSDQLLNAWGRNVKDVVKLACDNTKALNPLNIVTMDDLMDDPDFSEILDDELPSLFVITSEPMRNGAIYMLDKKLMQKLADESESDLLIVPHSVDGVLVTPFTEEMADAARRMCADCEVDAFYLSNHPYMFNRGLGKVVM